MRQLHDVQVDGKFPHCESDSALSLAFEIAHLRIRLRRRTSAFIMKFDGILFNRSTLHHRLMQCKSKRLNEAAKKLRPQYSPIPSFLCKLGASASGIGGRLP